MRDRLRLHTSCNIRDCADCQDAISQVPRGDDLRDDRHSNEVSSLVAQRADFGRRLVAWSGVPGENALKERKSKILGARAGDFSVSSVVDLAHVRETGA